MMDIHIELYRTNKANFFDISAFITKDLKNPAGKYTTL